MLEKVVEVQDTIIPIFTYRLMHKWGFKQKVPRKSHVNTASKEEKERFKKEQERYWIPYSKKKKKKKASQ